VIAFFDSLIMHFVFACCMPPSHIEVVDDSISALIYFQVI